MNTPFNFADISQSEALRQLKERYLSDPFRRTVTLYDQFGRPVYVPSTEKKIGDTITVRKPHHFKEAQP